MVARFVVITCLIAAPVFAADDFYEQQLRAGKADAQANRLPQAADELRIAAFGFLQQPALLQEALIRLAVVQIALGQTGDASKTIDRFVDVEQRFPQYASVQVETPIKTKFEEMLAAQIPRPTLQAIPSLARLSNYELQKIAAMPSSQRLAAYEAGAQREPKNPDWFIALTKESAARDSQVDVIRWGARALELDPANRDVKTLVAHARASRRECKEALAIISDLDPQKNPDLYADQAVCFVQMSRWKDAETALASIPSGLKNRPDVKSASQAVSKENARLNAENARIAQEKKRQEDARIAAEKKREADRLAAEKQRLDRERAASNATKSAATTPATTTPGTAAPSTRGAAAVPQTSSAPPKSSLKAADVIEASRKLIKESKYSDAVKTLRPAVQVESDNRSLRLALLEAAVLARDFRTAATQVPVVTPLTPGEELYMFYASVALYETGRHDEAKLFMEKARTRMVPSPMVDYYVKTILGQQRGS
jgi:hypothetical protein